MTLRILVLSLFLCSLAYAAETQNSPPPNLGLEPQSSAKTNVERHHNKLNDDHNSVVPEGIVEISPASMPKMGVPEKDEERHGYVSSEWWLVYLTGALAFVTLGLAIYTARLYHATVGLGREAKSTSDMQADALKAIERAYLFVDILIGDTNIPTDAGWKGKLQLKIWNYGKTPAEIVQIRAYTTVDKSVPQGLLEHPRSEMTLPPGLGIAQNRSFDELLPFSISESERSDIECMSSKLYCVGKIRYRDIFNLEHETGFCWVYRNDLSAYIICPSSGLNHRS